jgi:hypothetical protein
MKNASASNDDLEAARKAAAEEVALGRASIGQAQANLDRMKAGV